jgi:antitoxin component YwqK of YwqJK toxin-antitoxin module
LWKRWWKNGKLKSQGRYENGKKVRSWQYWDENGNLIKIEEYPETDPPEKEE